MGKCRGVDRVRRLHLVELVGPLVDDGGSFARTLCDVLAAAGLPLRAGASDLTEGSVPEHAIATVLGGHGRDDDQAAVDRLAGEVRRRWARLTESRECRAAPGAADWVASHLAAGGAVGVVSNLPGLLVATLLERTGLPALAVAEGSRGLPHPDAILALADAMAVPRELVTVVARSPAVLLAATQAGVAEMVLLGPGSARWMELVPITARYTALSDLPDPV
jgi:phosphoglycolate phosphatase-like HAD superfamily hydrolase